MAKNAGNRMDSVEQQLAELTKNHSELVRNQQETSRIQQDLQKQVENLNLNMEETTTKIDQILKILLPSKGKEAQTSNPVTPANHTSSSVNLPHARGGAGVLMPSPQHTPNTGESKLQVNSKFPKVDFPKFVGERPRHWLRKCNKYFLVNRLSDYEKILLAGMHMEGSAENWYSDYVDGRENMLWDQFAELVLDYFQNYKGENLVGQFKNLRQEGSVQDYIADFEELKSFMSSTQKYLTEDYFIKNFISGLKEDIGKMVGLFEPSTLASAIQLARKQEIRLVHGSKTSKEANKGYTNVSGQWKGNPGNNSDWSKSKVNVGSEDKTLPVKRLTSEEIELRRKQNLCFNCDEPYSFGHRCKKLYVIIGKDPPEGEEVHLTEVEEDGNGEVKISLHALSGQIAYSTIKLKATAGNNEMTVLIDTGSTHSFIDPEIARNIGCTLEYTNPMVVTVADGSKTRCDAKCDPFEWEMGGYRFSAPVRVLRLGGYDMVLGVDFMRQMGPTTFDFAKQKVQFLKNGRNIVLQGIQTPISMSMISAKQLKRALWKGSEILFGCLCKTSGEEGEVVWTEMAARPVKTLAQRFIKKNNSLVTQVLVQWEHLLEEEATWENRGHIAAQFPHLLA